MPKTLMTLMPPSAQILGVGPSSKGFAIFALVDPTEEATEPRTFHLAKTGESLPEGLEYLTSVTLPGINLHLFAEPQA